MVEPLLARGRRRSGRRPGGLEKGSGGEGGGGRVIKESVEGEGRGGGGRIFSNRRGRILVLKISQYEENKDNNNNG